MSASIQFKRFLDKHHKIRILQEIENILNWDKQTMLPPGSAERRGEQCAVISTEMHALRTAPDYRQLLEELSTYNLDPQQTAAVRVELREMRRSSSVPASLVAEVEKQKSRAYSVWQVAKREKDSRSFLPELEKMIHLRKQVGECCKGPSQTAYDGLLSEYEPGITSSFYEKMFQDIKPELISLLRKLKARQAPIAKMPPVSVTEQQSMNLWTLGRLGYDFHRGRLDTAPHPFASPLGGDVRLTTRYDVADWRKSLYGSLHEMGHGLYELGMLDHVAMEPQRNASGLGMHESQSRFWENQIGRSREFCRFLVKHAPAEQRRIFGEDAERLFEQVNDVRAGFTRVEADELTYNLHVLLRFEIERSIFSGDIRAGELSQIWNERFKAMFDLPIPSDDLGVLQDIHWSIGYFGYFPTYTLGNLIAAQLRETISEDMGFASAIEDGDFARIREWLGQKVHKFGNSHPSLELVRMSTGQELSSEPMIRYFKKKFDAQVYC